MIESVKTTCPYCGVGCGVLARPDGKDGAAIQGDPKHPANFGRLCSKGSALGETLDPEGRLLAPQISGQPATWEASLDLVAGKFRDAIDTHGPDAVAFYVSGQLLTEDYYVANKLMKGFIGSANIDTNSRLCMASSVAGHKRAFGTDTVPGTYEDFEQADLIVLVGSNLAWCHPVLFQRIAAEKEKRPSLKVVNIDPRRTATSQLADMHLALRPGSDISLFNGLLSEIDRRGAVNYEFAKHVNGLDEAVAAALSDDPSQTGLTEDERTTFYDLWISKKRVVTIYSQGVNQSSYGTDKVNAILNCHLATGRIGTPGTGPFSVTGQPNAMGGREVGGLANMLACHLDLENAEHRNAVKTFWGAPAMPEAQGLKAVDLFEAVAQGKIKALWIMSTNPAVSMPDAAHVRQAIKDCPFVVVSDIMERTDTGDLADVLLPATGWGEKSGTVTNSDRTISRQRAFLQAPAEAQPDWKIICDVAAKMGWAEAFDYANPAEIFREHAALSGLAAHLGKDFDISGFAEMSDAEYDALGPTRWPYTGGRDAERFFADGAFFTPDQKARLLPVSQPKPSTRTSSQFPLRLNTGRNRDQWHTMTRTGKSAKLSQHLAEPYIELHPEDALNVAVEAGALAKVTSPYGTATLRVLVSDRTPQGTAFAPIHWTAQWSSEGRVDDLVAPKTDPVSGQPALKGMAVRVEPYRPNWFGFAVSSKEFQPRSTYWARAKFQDGFRAELAGNHTAKDWIAYAKELFGLQDATVLSTHNSRGMARVALIDGEVLKGALFVSPDPVVLSRAHVVRSFSEADAYRTLAGWPGDDQLDPGPVICSCFDVGVNTIVNAIATQGLTDIEAIGNALQAGTNCGSCRPELRGLLAAQAPQMAAE